MVCKRVLLFVLFCTGIFTANRAQGFLGLALRVGVFYTMYKFVDGLSDGLVSRFVDRNIDAPLDAISSFGKGVKTFGLGVRVVVTTFVRQRSDGAFSEMWSGLQHEYGRAVAAVKQEWNERRENTRAKESIEEHQAQVLEQEQKKKNEPKVQLKAVPSKGTNGKRVNVL